MECSLCKAQEYGCVSRLLQLQKPTKPQTCLATKVLEVWSQMDVFSGRSLFILLIQNNVSFLLLWIHIYLESTCYVLIQVDSLQIAMNEDHKLLVVIVPQ